MKQEWIRALLAVLTVVLPDSMSQHADKVNSSPATITIYLKRGPQQDVGYVGIVEDIRGVKPVASFKGMYRRSKTLIPEN